MGAHVTSMWPSIYSETVRACGSLLRRQWRHRCSRAAPKGDTAAKAGTTRLWRPGGKWGQCCGERQWRCGELLGLWLSKYCVSSEPTWWPLCLLVISETLSSLLSPFPSLSLEPSLLASWSDSFSLFTLPYCHGCFLSGLSPLFMKFVVAFCICAFVWLPRNDGKEKKKRLWFSSFDIWASQALGLLLQIHLILKNFYFVYHLRMWRKWNMHKSKLFWLMTRFLCFCHHHYYYYYIVSVSWSWKDQTQFFDHN